MPLNPKKHEMPVQEPSVRAHNFSEVALGYTPEIAFEEAARCLNCKNAPCVQGCPVNIDIPGFIAKLKNKATKVKGYQVYVHKNKKFKHKKGKKDTWFGFRPNKKLKNKKIRFNRPTKKKTYLKVRAYVKLGKKKYIYGPWSNVKVVK